MNFLPSVGHRPALSSSQFATPQYGSSRAQKAFSLVEVVLALGIIGFAFVGVVGMLPIGLGISRQAIDATVEAQIAQQLTTQAQQTNFSTLPELAEASQQEPYYFDDQGNPVDQSTGQSGADADLANYVAAYDITMNTSLPENASTGSLATVKIMVLNTTGQRTDTIQDPLQSEDAKKHILLIPDNGR